jgi:hypothetical protein
VVSLTEVVGEIACLRQLTTHVEKATITKPSLASSTFRGK